MSTPSEQRARRFSEKFLCDEFRSDCMFHEKYDNGFIGQLVIDLQVFCEEEVDSALEEQKEKFEIWAIENKHIGTEAMMAIKIFLSTTRE